MRSWRGDAAGPPRRPCEHVLEGRLGFHSAIGASGCERNRERTDRGERHEDRPGEEQYHQSVTGLGVVCAGG